MRRGDVGERQRRQQRKADDDAEGDDGERCEVGTCRSLLAKQQQQRQRDQAGDGGAGDGQEHRVEAHHRHAGGRQRSAEDQTPIKPFIHPADARSMLHSIRSIVLPYPPDGHGEASDSLVQFAKLLWSMGQYG
jgi:hypothetical protein